MFEIRKALKSEEEIIIDVANKAFIPERYADFDFRKVMPKVYARPNFYKDHFVVLKDNQIIGVSGNLIRCLSLNNKCYKYSMVGSVSTLPDYRNLGVMKQMMSSIEKENEEEDVVFSILTGVRKRYNWHNYEKATQRIVFNFQDYLIHHSKNDLVSLKLYEDSMLDDLYNVYLRNQILSLRKKEDFIISLKRSDAVIFGIVLEDKIIGYFAFSLKKEKITEMK